MAKQTVFTKPVVKGARQAPKTPVVQPQGKQKLVAPRKKKVPGGVGGGGFFPSGRAWFAGRPVRDSMVQDEYVAEVAGSVAFATTAYPFNPGQSLLFPRFSKEAVLYEKWVCVSAEPYFKPEVSAYNSQGSGGKVMLSFDYDAADPPPASKQQVEDSFSHSDGMGWEAFALPLDPDELNGTVRGKFVRPGGVPGGSDIKTYDGGVLYVSTVGQAGTGVVGELRIRYRFVLVKPVLESTTTAPAVYSASVFQSSMGEGLTSSTPAQLALATTVVNGLSATNTSGSIAIGPGNYIIDADIQFSGSANAGSTYGLNFKVGGLSQSLAPTFAGSGSTFSAFELHGSYFVSVASATTLTLVAEAGFASGTCTAIGQLIVRSIG